jgi:hypothetical protein
VREIRSLSLVPKAKGFDGWVRSFTRSRSTFFCWFMRMFIIVLNFDDVGLTGAFRPPLGNRIDGKSPFYDSACVINSFISLLFTPGFEKIVLARMIRRTRMVWPHVSFAQGPRVMKPYLVFRIVRDVKRDTDPNIQIKGRSS